ncbi:acetylesterase [Ligilactobacillus aviarius]|uniref:alpha/beta hydrolase n=1 Tax=Ligilactobacillus aviarius TaxID=1606 RepID=UPI0007D9C157|nr:alpha/beta hydrolase [Ligilactobacillus aviarius]OAQ08857.1 acetylesterase [Ligilactobacillus aviarius]OAS76334.1 acetylesterase [Ligilactobacillus aviarius]HJH33519.1 alpha/beta hydrolase [Ligilactobacillus aviarius]
MQYLKEKIKTSFEDAELTGYVLDNSPEIDENRVRPAVIICPGGGYKMVSEREGEPIAVKLLGMGAQAFVLNYSCMPVHHPAQLAQLATAVKMVRDNAAQWHVDPNKIIVMGTSAGGHLAGMLATMWNSQTIKDLGFNPEDVKPNGLIMGYSVVTADQQFGHQGSFDHLLGEDATPEEREKLSLQKHVSKDTPMAFIWTTTEDTTVPMENSLMMVEALRKNGVNFEFHVFPHGQHGHSLATKETANKDAQIVPTLQVWPELLETWLHENF